MERKKASDYPQELLDLFHEYQHGEITRRSFFDRAGKFAVGGLTVAAIFESKRRAIETVDLEARLSELERAEAFRKKQ